MSGFTFQIKGADAAIKRTEELAKKARENAQLALNAFGLSVERDAKRLAPADEGHLRNSINSKPGNLSVTVTVGVNYAAYLEFGTRKFAAKYVATLPADWQSYAATFKGKGTGSMDEFIQNIMEWVRRKGIGADTTGSGNVSSSRSSLDKQQQAAYWIALNILQNGIRPHPFLYPAIYQTGHLKELKKQLQNIFK